MKAQLSKQAGLALALLAALLATLLAMGVYSAAQADSHNATRSFSATSVAPGDQITVTITLENYGRSGVIEETLPPGFTFVSSASGGSARGDQPGSVHIAQCWNSKRQLRGYSLPDRR